MAASQVEQDATPWPSEAAVADLQERLLGWYAANGRDLPWRRTRDPYAILVSEIMLQQTQVSRVLPRYEAWLRVYPRLEDLAAAPLQAVLLIWQGLGYNNRARRLHECAIMTCATSGQSPAALPTTFAELRRLPGIGPYTARALLAFAHNQDVAAVDTNVRRVLTRELDLPPDLPAAALQRIAETAVPHGRSRDWHNALMDYGALVCTARAGGPQPVPKKSSQTPFVGSRRWLRSRLLRAVLVDGPLSLMALAATIDLPVRDAAEIVALLERDGLLTIEGDVVRVA